MFRNTYKYKIIIYCLCLLNTNLFSQTKQEIISDLNLNIGLTCFKNPFRNEGINNDMAIIAKSGSLGLEFFNKKINSSIEVRKIYWLSLSASNFYNSVNAWASYSNIGFTKYFDLGKDKKLGVNLSHVWIAENSTIESYNKPSTFSKFFYINYYTAKAVRVASSINLTKKLNLEVSANVYYSTRNDSISTGINNNRIQFSIIYKINPLKK